MQSIAAPTTKFNSGCPRQLHAPILSFEPDLTVVELPVAPFDARVASAALLAPDPNWSFLSPSIRPGAVDAASVLLILVFWTNEFYGLPRGM
jgi:hypothetical protein